MRRVFEYTSFLYVSVLQAGVSCWDADNGFFWFAVICQVWHSINVSMRRQTVLCWPNFDCKYSKCITFLSWDSLLHTCTCFPYVRNVTAFWKPEEVLVVLLVTQRLIARQHWVKHDVFLSVTSSALFCCCNIFFDNDMWYITLLQFTVQDTDIRPRNPVLS